MKHKFSFVITLWWVLLLCFLGAMLIWLIPKHERISATENRTLAGAPKFSVETILDGSFMDGTEEFFADGFFLRETIIHLSSDIKRFFDIRGADEILLPDMEQAVNDFMDEYEQKPKEIALEEEKNAENIVNDTSGEIQEPETTDTPPEEAENLFTEDPEDFPEPTEGEYTFWLDLPDGTQRIVYYYPKENLDTSIAALNAYRQALPEDGELHFMQIPYSGLGNMLYNRPRKYDGWGCNAEDYMQQNADEGVYIHKVTDYLEQPLLNHERLFFRTDYHWAPLGAYYAHAGIMEYQGIPHLLYEDYDYTIYDDYLGMSYLSTLADQLEDIEDTIEVLHPVFPAEGYVVAPFPEQTKDKVMSYSRHDYMAYLGGSRGPWRRFVTGADTGRKAVIISDSFGNAFAPYMFAYYDEVHILDLRPAYFTKRKSESCVRDYIEYFGIDDAYVMLATSSSMNSVYMLQYLMEFLDY